MRGLPRFGGRTYEKQTVVWCEIILLCPPITQCVVLTQQARVLNRVDAFVASEAASLLLRGATHRAFLISALLKLKEASENLNSQQSAAEQVKILCDVLRANQEAEEQEEKLEEIKSLLSAVYRRQRDLREVCNRGRPTLHRDI